MVFALFFFVNTPDDMARLHLGMKRVTKDQIDAWKREHSLDLPYFINRGWVRVDTLTGSKEKNFRRLNSLPRGVYRIIIEGPENSKLLGKRSLKIYTSNEYKNEYNLEKLAHLDRFEFTLSDNKRKKTDANWVEIEYSVSIPGLSHRLIVEYKAPISSLASLTNTIFFKRSLKMLFFEYGKSDKGQNISSQIKKRIVPSLSITLPAFMAGLFINIFFAMILAFFRGTYIDYWGVFLCVLGMSVSMLFYIIGGQVIFGKIFRLFPISGFDFGMQSIKFVTLPVLIAVIGGIGGTVRFYRTIFLEEINKDYVRTARAKGLPERTVLFIHTLKNAMIPILTGAIVVLPLLFTGSLLLESFFAIPGMGSYLIDAINQQDFAVVQATVSLGSFFYIIGLLLTDISYTIFDPRVRLE